MAVLKMVALAKLGHHLYCFYKHKLFKQDRHCFGLSIDLAIVNRLNLVQARLQISKTNPKGNAIVLLNGWTLFFYINYSGRTRME